MTHSRYGYQWAFISSCLVLASCATVRIEPPDKPIEINLNIKLEHELRVKLDKEVEELIESNPDIF